jgi:hypothetical protein
MHRHAVDYSTYLRGPRSGPGCSVPAPHSQAHRDFTAWRLIRDAFAVRERLGDPRVVPSFRCTSLPGMPPSPTPGSPTSLCSRASMPTWPSPFDHRLGTPDPPAIRSTRAAHFVASLVRFRYGLPSCSPPCADRTGTPQPSGAFTTRLSTDWSPSPLLVITTTVTGLLLLAGLAPAGMAASFAARSKRATDSVTSGGGTCSDSGHTRLAESITRTLEFR